MDGSVGVAASEDQARENDAKGVLEGGRGEAEAMELEEIAVVEAVAEQTAAMEAVEIEREPAEKRREVGLDGGIGLRSRVERRGGSKGG